MESPYAVVAGPASSELGKNLASDLGFPLVLPEVKVFSDGESKIRIDGLGLQGRTCIIVQSTYPPVDRHLMQMLMLAHGCHQQGARELIAIAPYLGYSRQDRAFLNGEVVSINLVSELMSAASITHLITVDIHSVIALSHFSVKVDNLSAIPRLADFIRSLNLKEPLAVSPDCGGTERARQFGDLLHCDTISLKKTRNRQTGDVSVEDIKFNLVGRDAILVDDIISSGISVAKASDVLRKNGARRVYAICSHALLIDGAQEKIKNAGINDVIASNSVPSEYSRVDLAPSLAEAVRNRLALKQEG